MTDLSQEQLARFLSLVGHRVRIITHESLVVWKAARWRRWLARKLNGLSGEYHGPLWRLEVWLRGDIDFEPSDRTGEGVLTAVTDDFTMKELAGGDWLAVLLDDKWFCYLHDTDEIEEL